MERGVKMDGMGITRASIDRGALLLMGTLFAFVFLVGTATAGEVHGPVGLIGSPGSGNGQLSLGERSGVAVNIETGNIYVSDTGNHRVEEFQPDGTFVRTFAPAGSPSFAPTSIAVDNSGDADTGDVYVVDSSTFSVFKFEPDGTEITDWVPNGSGGFVGKLTLTELIRVAVGPDGSLYLATDRNTLGSATYGRYSPSGALLGSFQNGFTPTSGLSIDTDGNLLVSDGGSSNRGTANVELSPTGATLGQRILSDPVANATDPSTGDLFIASQSEHRIDVFAQACGTLCGQGQGPGKEPLETFARGELSDPQGMGVGPDHVLYVAEAGTSRISVWALEFVAPPTVSIDGPTGITSSSVHVSGHINPGAPEGDHPGYKVNWVFKCFEVSEVEPGVVTRRGFFCGAHVGEGISEIRGELPADAVDHLVEGTIDGLSPGTEYEIRLFAENAANHVEPGVTLVTGAAAPTVGESFALEITTSEVTLYAEELNPRGAETAYFFEYVPLAAFESEGFTGPQTRVTPTATIPAGNREREVSARITGLPSGAKYAYRFVADNAKGHLIGATEMFATQTPSFLPTGSCANDLFRTGSGTGLPDCRAYELVTPVDKRGLNVEGFPDLLRAAAGGVGGEPGVTFYSQGGSGFPAGGGAHQEFTALLSARRSGVWSSQRLLPPAELAETAVFLGSSSNLRFALLAGGTAEKTGLFLLDTATEEVHQIAQAKTGLLSTFGADAIGDDGSWILFEAKVPLEGVSGAKAGFDNVYRWDRASGKVSVAGVLPAAEGGKAPPQGSFGGAYAWQSSDTFSGGALADLYVEAIHAASPDGDQIYFTAGKSGQLYLRRGLTGTGPVTTKVSAPAAGVTPTKPHPAAFQEATPDGSSAFFLSAQALTQDAHAPSVSEEEAGAEHMNLYRWDSDSGSLVDVAPDPGSGNPGGPEVEGILGVAADGASGYFAAKGVLADGATLGKNNIYRFEEEGAGFRLTFVASLGDGVKDIANWSSTSYSGRVIGNYSGKAARVTPDGKELIFSSKSSLTGFDNHGCGEFGNEACVEIFMYGTSAGEVTCLSCNPTGARPAGDAELTAQYLNANLVPAVAPTPILTRNISSDGTRVFFQTPDSLVAADTNGPPNCTYLDHQIHSSPGKPRCMDVYEWEAPGQETASHSCTETSPAYVPGSQGCIYLLSSGNGAEASYLVDASADGEDAFIATTSQGVPVDRDGLFDVYDVRIGGGLAAQQVLPGVPCSSDESCHGAPAPPPGAESAPGSSSYEGPGNVKPAKPRSCKKRGRKCKKPKHGKHRNHRRHHHKSQGQASSRIGGSK